MKPGIQCVLTQWKPGSSPSVRPVGPGARNAMEPGIQSVLTQRKPSFIASVRARFPGPHGRRVNVMQSLCDDLRSIAYNSLLTFTL